MSPSGAELLRQVKSQIEEVDPSEVKELIARGRRASSTCARPRSSPPATCPAPSTCPRSYLESRIEGVVPDRSHAGDPLLRLGQPLGLRRAHADRGARLRARALDDRRHHAVEGPRLRGRGPAHAHAPSSATATRATCSSPRSASRASRSCSTPRCCCSAPVAWARRPRCIWPPPAWARSGIVDDDVVDLSNLQRQVIHTTDARRRPQGRLRRGDDQGAEPGRQRRQVQDRASTPRTSWRSSRATT